MADLMDDYSTADILARTPDGRRMTERERRRLMQMERAGVDLMAGDVRARENDEARRGAVSGPIAEGGLGLMAELTGVPSIMRGAGNIKRGWDEGDLLRGVGGAGEAAMGLIPGAAMSDNMLANALMGRDTRNLLSRDTLKPGPEPTGYDRIRDGIYNMLGGRPEDAWAANKLATALDFGTLGMLTGAYDGGQSLAKGQGPSQLAMALMPGAKPANAATKVGAAAAREIIGSMPKLRNIEKINDYVTRVRIEPRPEKIERPEFRILSDGTPVFAYPEHLPQHVWDPGPRLFRKLDDYISPLGADTYWRGAKSKRDVEYLTSGSHKGSINHATGEKEGGLSVARVPEPYGYDYWYKVKGNKIGYGSDGEPLLDVHTARPASGLLTFDKAQELNKKLVSSRLAELGIHPDDWKALTTGGYLPRDEIK